MKYLKNITKTLILIAMIVISSLTFNGCSTKYIKSEPPKIIALDCNETVGGSFKKDKKYVYIPIKDFKKLIKKCSQIKSKCNFMYNEIIDYNKRFVK